MSDTIEWMEFLGDYWYMEGDIREPIDEAGRMRRYGAAGYKFSNNETFEEQLQAMKRIAFDNDANIIMKGGGTEGTAKWYMKKISPEKLNPENRKCTRNSHFISFIRWKFY